MELEATKKDYINIQHITLQQGLTSAFVQLLFCNRKEQSISMMYTHSATNFKIIISYHDYNIILNKKA